MLFAVLALVGMLGLHVASAEEVKITPEEALKIARKEASSTPWAGISPTFLEIYKRPKNQCFEILESAPSFRADIMRVKAVLAGRRYYLVMNKPLDMAFGLTKCIFIDAMSGKVLAHGNY